MAPTLMGAHKDLFCDRCETNFPVGASWERSGGMMQKTVVAGICPNCRHLNALDLADDSGHQTFNGDRILVSKFAYTLAEPERWDVIVFKFPGNPKQNYIKRLVGLPNETLTVRHGDIYIRPTGSEPSKDSIVRKPPDKLLAMRHDVYDSDFQSAALISAGYPSRWQPWRENATSPPDDSWKIARDANGLTATLPSGSDQPQWLRYYHRWPSDAQWQTADSGGSLKDVDPYSSRLISDFYAYNSFVHVSSDLVYRVLPNERLARSRLIGRLFGTIKSFFVGPDFELNSAYQSGESPDQFGRYATYGGSRSNTGRDGTHWVGDLLIETDLETSSDCREIVLELIESGVKHHCTVDLTSGKAALTLEYEGQPQSFTDATGKSTQSVLGDTVMRAGGRYQLRFSNCDDQLLLWIDDELVEFDGATTFQSSAILTGAQQYPRYAKGVHPLDAAPAAVALRGGTGTVHRLSVDRDKYYIATMTSSGEMSDYDQEVFRRAGGGGVPESEAQAVFARPDDWEGFALWPARRSVSFTMQEDQFFPMGDNSPASLDARCWAGTKALYQLPSDFEQDAYKWASASYVPRDLLVGKALLVFWPHPWSRPVPFTPNFKRFKLIR
ncbi:MAG: signal peptidase I [Pirellulaceae bacterium]|nr:signal peptidase I [Pirellulaceae bacterium]